MTFLLTTIAFQNMLGIFKKITSKMQNTWYFDSSKEIHICKKKVRYVGFIVNENGVKTVPNKVKAIREFPRPTNLTELRLFMGLVNQLAGYSKKLIASALPLRPLLKSRKEFQWMNEHTEAFNVVKKLVSNFPIRALFDPRLPTILKTDAARLKEMGYVLMQLHTDNQYRLIEAGSRWLTPAEQNYGMTSLELEAVNWDVEKCKTYLLVLTYFEIVTDHQVLVSILNTKPLDEIENPRQQNMKEKIQQRYNFKVKWQAEKKMMISDALSRATIDEAYDVHNPQIYRTATERMIVHSLINQDVEKIFGDQKLNTCYKRPMMIKTT